MPKLEKGFLFAIMFLLFATLLLSFAVFYSQLGNEKTNEDFGYVTDNIGNNLLTVLGTKAEILKSQGTTKIIFTDSIPSSLNSPDNSLSEYRKFLTLYYSTELNGNMSVDNFQPAIAVTPFGLSYRYSSMAKNSISITSEQPIAGYEIKVRLPYTCDSECQNSASVNWTWANNGIPVTLDISDSENNKIVVNGLSSGYINQTSSLDFTLPGGSYDLNVYNSITETASGTPVYTSVGVLYNSTPPTSVSIPADVTVNGIRTDSLTIEKA